MSRYKQDLQDLSRLMADNGANWQVGPENAARMRTQNRFKTGLDIARYTAAIMREDMAAYDADPGAYTRSLGCWHGFIAQQNLIAVKKHLGNTRGTYLYLSGWMIAALRSEFGPLPDQSMHENLPSPGGYPGASGFIPQTGQCPQGRG